MVKSMVSGVAGLRSHQAKMDVIGNNISNVNTYGFKSSRASFRDALYVTSTGASNATATYGGGNPMQTGYGSTIGSIDPMHVRGAFMPTDYPTDCMINGQGFFLVGPNLGPLAVNMVTSLNLTRVGSFVFDGAGNFVDMNRNLVYGFTAVPSWTQLEIGGVPQFEKMVDPAYVMPLIEDPPASGIFVPDPTYLYPPIPDPDNPGSYLPNPKDPALYIDNPARPIMYVESYSYDYGVVEPLVIPNDYFGNPLILKQITIGPDGSIIGIDDDNNIVEVGKIAVANVPNPSALEMSSNSYFIAKANTGEILASVPGENTTGSLQAGGLEMSNVDLAKEFTEMITTQRGFQANTRIITVTDEMLAELVNMKR